MKLDNKNMKIVYMGTPDFAVAPLKALIEAGQKIVGVITAPDKPAGRGQKIQQSAVKQFAVENDLYVLQPTKLKNPEFLDELRALKADLQVVVAFRMLPEVVWDMPPRGTFNLHASLLPQYRGAAPINWAVINGDKVSGVTTFFIEQAIDTGKILFQEQVAIDLLDSAGTLHDKLMKTGAQLVVKTVQAVASNNYTEVSQNERITDVNELRAAPKIFKDDCRIQWQKEGLDIYNFVRGMSPYPTAWATFEDKKGHEKTVKIFETEYIAKNHSDTTGELITDGKKFLKVAVKGGFICLKQIQVQGKKRMDVESFLRGSNFTKLIQ